MYLYTKAFILERNIIRILNLKKNSTCIVILKRNLKIDFYKLNVNRLQNRGSNPPSTHRVRPLLIARVMKTPYTSPLIVKVIVNSNIFPSLTCLQSCKNYFNPFN